MTITVERVREIFNRLERGDNEIFFADVADDVDWTVMGTQPLAGRFFDTAVVVRLFQENPGH